MSVPTIAGGGDPVADFEQHRWDMRRQKLVMNLLFAGGFLLLLAFSINVSRFFPDRLAAGLPRIFEYFGSILPALQWDVLFEGRNEAGRAAPGSLLYWYSDIGKYLRLLVETIFMALTATILGAAVAFLLSFPAARNLAPNGTIYWITRRVMEFFRGVPEILYALVFVAAVGIGPLPGILALIFFNIGVVAKLLSETVDGVDPGPIEAARASGGNRTQMVRWAVLPQVLPNLIQCIRLSLVPAWIFLISAEAIASTSGLGYRIFLVRRYLAMDVILPYVAWITLLAYLLDRLLLELSRRAFRWHHTNGASL
jgi:phosphonate transport system permease protein